MSFFLIRSIIHLPYADTLVFSEENLPIHGIEFNGMIELLREDPQTDPFSSANAMASILSDRGITILGEHSGGGSCSVQYCGTADGWLYTISNNIHLVNQAGEDIDSGVPVKEKLVTEGEDGRRDYSGFYDPDRIRDCINERG